MYTLALSVVAAAFLFLWSHNPVHGVLTLVVVGLGLALGLLNAGLEFTAFVVVLVYVGAVTVLFVFVVMMVNLRATSASFVLVESPVVWAVLVGGLALTGWSIPGGRPAGSLHLSDRADLAVLGSHLYGTERVLLVALVGLVLFVSMVAAICLSLVSSENYRTQDYYTQIRRPAGVFGFVRGSSCLFLGVDSVPLEFFSLLIVFFFCGSVYLFGQPGRNHPAGRVFPGGPVRAGLFPGRGRRPDGGPVFPGVWWWLLGVFLAGMFVWFFPEAPPPQLATPADGLAAFHRAERLAWELTPFVSAAGVMVTTTTTDTVTIEGLGGAPRPNLEEFLGLSTEDLAVSTASTVVAPLPSWFWWGTTWVAGGMFFWSAALGVGAYLWFSRPGRRQGRRVVADIFLFAGAAFSATLGVALAGSYLWYPEGFAEVVLRIHRVGGAVKVFNALQKALRHTDRFVEYYLYHVRPLAELNFAVAVLPLRSRRVGWTLSAGFLGLVLAWRNTTVTVPLLWGSSQFASIRRCLRQFEHSLNLETLTDPSMVEVGLRVACRLDLSSHRQDDLFDKLFHPFLRQMSSQVSSLSFGDYLGGLLGEAASLHGITWVLLVVILLAGPTALWWRWARRWWGIPLRGGWALFGSAALALWITAFGLYVAGAAHPPAWVWAVYWSGQVHHNSLELVQFLRFFPPDLLPTWEYQHLLRSAERWAEAAGELHRGSQAAAAAFHGQTSPLTFGEYLRFGWAEMRGASLGLWVATATVLTAVVHLVWPHLQESTPPTKKQP